MFSRDNTPLNKNGVTISDFLVKELTFRGATLRIGIMG